MKRYVGREEPLREDFFLMSHARFRYVLAILWHKFLSFASLLCSWLTLLVACVGIGVLMALYYTGTKSDLPIVLLSSAIIFPISFGISFNYNRREAALRDLATLKSSSLVIWYGCRDFPVESPALASSLQRLRHAFSVLFSTVSHKMAHNVRDLEGTQVYLALDQVQLSVHNVALSEDNFRNTAMYVRIQQAMQTMVESMERLLVIHDYRNPSSLRAFAMVYLTLYPAIFAPLFSLYCHLYGIWSGIYCSLLSSVMFVALYKIFLNEEDPFDGSGFDDLSLEPLTAHLRHMTSNRHSNVKISVFSEGKDKAWGHRTYEELPEELERNLETTMRHESKSFIRLKEI